jgi:hypothetical protein
MLFVASVLAASSPCSPTAIAAAAIVSPAQQESPAAVGLSNIAVGFQRPSVQEISWQGPCTPNIVGLYGGRTLVTSNDLMLSAPRGSTLEVRDDSMLPADPEPPHPEWQGHRFVGSASLLSGNWRVGAWVRRDGVTDIARYRPGDETPPISLMTFAQPLVGLYYLGLPDAVGGTLFFAQRLGPSQFRMIAMDWSEAGLRAPVH